MIRYFVGILICYFCFATLFADEENFIPSDEPFVSSLVKTQNLLSTVVDSVSAISGEWIHSETDFVVLGPEPLILNRYYTGDHSHHDKLGYNWNFSRPNPLILELKENKKRQANALARLHQTSGIATIHESRITQNDLKETIHPLLLSRTQGLTNCRGEISGKTNLHNTVIELDFKGKRCVAISGSGHLTYYEFAYQQDLTVWKQAKLGVGHYTGHVLDHYQPIYERKPNGNTIHFGKEIISAANSSNTQVYGTLQFENEGIDTLRVKASDGKTATYKFSIYDHIRRGSSGIKFFHKHRYYLSEASFNHKPTETYEYTQLPPPTLTDDPQNPLLKAKRGPNGRFQEVEYYHQGRNSIDMSSDKREEIRTIHLDHENDFRAHRVKIIKAPVGHDGIPVITHRFIYEADEFYQPVKKTHHSFSGRTKVYDAYLRKTVYEYNKEHRPISIKHYDGKKKLYSEECYTWDDSYAYPDDLIKNKETPKVSGVQTSVTPQFLSSLSKSIDSILPKISTAVKRASVEDLIKACFKSKILQRGRAGNLLGKYRKDAEGNILYAHFFEYDKSGNITFDRFYGNLKGIHSQLIELNLHDKPKQNSCECYERRFTYSNDEFNLLKTEEEENGKGIIYDYYPETDLIAAKYVTENSKIRLRQFFHYNSNATLIKLVKDDGYSKKEENLKGVSERHITYIHPRKEAPLGLPEYIEHKFIDLETQAERLLKKIVYHYSKEGYLLQQDHFDASDQPRYSLYWSYDSHGNVISEVNALGHEIVKRYDDNDNLILEEGPRSGDSKEYTYDFANRLISVQYKEDEKTWMLHYKYDLVGNRIAEMDRYGNETNYEYDDFNRLTRTIYPTIAGGRPQTEVIYDCLDHPIIETNAGGFVTTKSYNARGKVTSILHPDGQLERFEYHLDGTLAKKIASNGTTTHLTYDCFGRLLTETADSTTGVPLYEICNTYNSLHKISSTDAEGITTYFDYDGAGRLFKTTCLDKIEIYEYDLLGRLAKKKEPFDLNKMKVTCTEYDFLDRVIEERIEEEGQVLKKVSYTYDLLGNRTHVIEETAAGPSQHMTVYNIDKKPVKTVDPEGNETHITYEEVRNQLDQLVLQTITTDCLGRQTIITYDAMEQAVNIKRQDLNGVLLANQDLLYDRQGHVIRLIDHVIVNGQETRCIEIAFAYQAMGQLTCLTQAVGLAEQQITRTTYDSYGQKASVEKNDGTFLFYTYDPLGRLETYYSSDHSIDYQYGYNLRHQILHIKDRIQKTSCQFEYDKRGRLTTETLSTGISMTYAYDQLNRVIGLTLPDFSRVSYQYDALNLKQVERYKKERLLYTHCYETFDLAGLNLKATTINRQENVYVYDVQKRPLAFENRSFKQKKAQYDRCGRLHYYHLEDLIGSIHNHFAYDDNDHLISEEAHRYTCDSLHNRLTKDRSVYSSNGLHQLISNGEDVFTYDRVGNLKSKEKQKNITSYCYDASDRLISVNTGKETIHYTYDALNRRVTKIKGDQITRYLYVGQDEIGAMDEAGNIQELRILGQGHGAEIGASIAIELQDKIFCPLHDFQGNIVSLTDLSGNMMEAYRYTAFGETTLYDSKGKKTTTSLMGNPWRFSSKRVDEESGFIYFGRRYYDPVNGKWITADPSGLADGPNLYAYLHHHPVQVFDLYGLEEEPYYPLQNVEHDHKVEPPKSEEPTSHEPPLGFIEKRKQKKDRMFFCGWHQIAEWGLSFINGIRNKLKDVDASARALSEMADGNYVTFVHNQTHGLIADLVRCFFELYFYMETEAERNLTAKFDAFFNHASPDAFLFHECHSEGAIVTRNALRKYPEELRQRIIVAAYGPGAYIDDKYAYKVTHYRSTRDIVPLFDFVGAYRCRDSTVVIKPHPDAPWFDHPIDSPTYQRFRKEEVNLYRQQCGGALCD